MIDGSVWLTCSAGAPWSATVSTSLISWVRLCLKVIPTLRREVPTEDCMTRGWGLRAGACPCTASPAPATPSSWTRWWPGSEPSQCMWGVSWSTAWAWCVSLSPRQSGRCWSSPGLQAGSWILLTIQSCLPLIRCDVLHLVHHAIPPGGSLPWDRHHSLWRYLVPQTNQVSINQSEDSITDINQSGVCWPRSRRISQETGLGRRERRTSLISSVVRWEVLELMWP